MDVDDALRFACSLVTNNGPSSRYLDTWSGGSGREKGNPQPPQPPAKDQHQVQLLKFKRQLVKNFKNFFTLYTHLMAPTMLLYIVETMQRDPRVAAVGGGGGGAPASLISAPQAASSSSSSSSSAAATRTSEQKLLADLLRENSTLRARVEQLEAENKRLREGGQGGSSKRQKIG